MEVREAERKGLLPCPSELPIAGNCQRPEGLGVPKPYSLQSTSRKYCNGCLGENHHEGLGPDMQLCLG